MRRFLPVAVSAAGFALVLSGCSTNPVTDASNNVSFTSCSTVDCAGTLPSGAVFDIIMPQDWNGTLAIYSHGLAAERPLADVPAPSATPQPTISDSPGGEATRSEGNKPTGKDASESPPPEAERSGSAQPEDGGTEIQPRPGGPELAPLWGEGDRALADVMLQAGYAIAGARPPEPGWAVPAQMKAAEELHQYFSDNVATPNRVYVWGESTGGLASALLAEQHPEWVSGAVAMCAPLSGPIDSFNLSLDVAYAVRELLAPDLELVAYGSAEEAQRARQIAMSAIRKAADGSPTMQAKIAFIAGIGELPNVSTTETGTTWESQIAANAEAIGHLIEQNTVQREVVERRVAGNFSGNGGTDYALRISEEQRIQLEEVKAGLADKFLRELGAGVRITPDPQAVDRATAMGTLGPDLQVPTLTLHNIFDPVYIAQNVSSFEQVLSGGEPESAAKLVTAFMTPPSTYSEYNPATEGVGNCQFEPRTMLGAMIQLNQWVRNGTYPGRDTSRQSFKSPSVTLDYDPGPWPQMSATPQVAPSPQQNAAAARMRLRGRDAPSQGDPQQPSGLRRPHSQSDRGTR